MQYERDTKIICNTIKLYCLSNKIYERIDSYKEVKGSTPNCGACWPLAEAISRIINKEIYAIVDLRNIKQAQHAVVKIKNGFVDADGFNKESYLIKRFKHEELIKNPIILPWNQVNKFNLFCPSKLIEDMYKDILDLYELNRQRNIL